MVTFKQFFIVTGIPGRIMQFDGYFLDGLKPSARNMLTDIGFGLCLKPDPADG